MLFMGCGVLFFAFLVIMGKKSDHGAGCVLPLGVLVAVGKMVSSSLC